MLKLQEEHLAAASNARLYYKGVIAKAKVGSSLHILFDMAQQVCKGRPTEEINK